MLAAKGSSRITSHLKRKGVKGPRSVVQFDGEGEVD